MMNTPILHEARAWLADCVWADADEEYIYEEASEAAITQAVDKSYEGGWKAFVAACD